MKAGGGPHPDGSEGHQQSHASLVPPKDPKESAALVTIVVLTTAATVGAPVIIPMAIVAFRTTVTAAAVTAVSVPPPPQPPSEKISATFIRPTPLLSVSQNLLFLGRRVHREKKRVDRRHQPADQCPVANPAAIDNRPNQACHRTDNRDDVMPILSIPTDRRFDLRLQS